MTIDEQIAILQAAKDGKMIEVRPANYLCNEKNWEVFNYDPEAFHPDFYGYEYRIAKRKVKKGLVLYVRFDLAVPRLLEAAFDMNDLTLFPAQGLIVKMTGETEVEE